MQRGAGDSFIKRCARVAVVCGSHGERGVGGECTTRQTSCLQHEKQHDGESDSERERERVRVRAAMARAAM